MHTVYKYKCKKYYLGLLQLLLKFKILTEQI